MAFRLRKGRPSFGGNDVHHRFCLGEIDAAVQKGAFCKFSPCRRNGSAFEGKFQCFPQGFRRAVNLYFHDVFTGIGMRRFHKDGESFVDGAVFFHDVAEIHAVRFGVFEIFDFFRAEKGISYVGRTNAADSYNSYAPFAGACRNGCDRCFFVHTVLPFYGQFSFYCIIIYFFLYSGYGERGVPFLYRAGAIIKPIRQNGFFEGGSHEKLRTPR